MTVHSVICTGIADMSLFLTNFAAIVNFKNDNNNTSILNN